MRLLLVEDSPSLQRTLSTGLTRAGYSVDQAFDGESAQQYLASTQYDVVVLDIMLPKLDGLTLLERMRRRGDITQVLVLSARDTLDDRIKGLDIGADDYLVKPFSFEELLSRIRAQVRRADKGQQGMSSRLVIGEVAIDSIQRIVTVYETPLEITPHEYRLLELLVRRRGQVYSHDQLIERLYSTDHDVTRNVIEVHISALRRKLRAAGANDLIQTRRGFGYYVAA